MRRQGSNGAHHRLIQAFDGRPFGPGTAKLLAIEIQRAPGRTILVSSELAKTAIVHGRRHQLIERILELAARDDVALDVRPYSASVRRGIGGDFGESIGITWRRGDGPRKNRSLGPIGLEAMRRIAAEGGLPDGVRRVRLYMRLRAIGLCAGRGAVMAVGRRPPGAAGDRRPPHGCVGAGGVGARLARPDRRRGDAPQRFDPADPEHQDMPERVLAGMRRARAELLG